MPPIVKNRRFHYMTSERYIDELSLTYSRGGYAAMMELIERVRATMAKNGFQNRSVDAVFECVNEI